MSKDHLLGADCNKLRATGLAFKCCLVCHAVYENMEACVEAFAYKGLEYYTCTCGGGKAIRNFENEGSQTMSEGGK